MHTFPEEEIPEQEDGSGYVNPSFFLSCSFQVKYLHRTVVRKIENCMLTENSSSANMSLQSGASTNKKATFVEHCHLEISRYCSKEVHLVSIGRKIQLF